MGTTFTDSSASTTTSRETTQKMATKELIENKNMRILNLHGWRTSGDILYMQMGAWRTHIPADYIYIDAPFPAVGPPVDGIAQFYPDKPYYEWFLREPEEKIMACKNISEEYIMQYIRENGPFDVLLGFSQGASFVTRIAYLCTQESIPILALVLIGGVEPSDIHPTSRPAITIPSLHIHGEADPYLERSKGLLKYFDSSCATVLNHSEGHQIPSIRTKVYNQINTWLVHTTGISAAVTSGVAANAVKNK